MAKDAPETLRAWDAGFRRNYLDSLAHALTHYSKLSYKDDSFHDRKWALLSVAHAAEMFCNLLLATLDHHHPSDGRYPTLFAAIKQLREHTMFDRLSPGERYVIRDVFPLLPKLRNSLMHKPAPERLEIDDVTVALLALLYLSRRRMKVSASDLVNQDPPIEADVLAELRVRELDRWFIVAEQLVLEDYGRQYLDYCDDCNRFTLTPDLGCQACFAERSL